MKTQADEAETKIYSNPDTQESADKLVDKFPEGVVIETRELEVRSESGSDTSTDSSSSSSDSSSDSSSNDSCSGSSTESRTESSVSKPLATKPESIHENCEYATQAPLGTKPKQQCEYAAQVESWVERVPIGLGLCPWAGKSCSQGRLRYVTCEGDMPSDVAHLILTEAEMLTREDVAPLSTTLVACPHVAAWKDFDVFDDWVKSGINEELKGESLEEKVSLVSFHPKFLRWRGLPEGVTVGSVVQSYWGTAGRKSLQTFPATVIDTNPSIFGLRKVKVRFDDGMGEQFVPIDWFADSVDAVGPPLPDNAMHRAPHPTVHLIRNADLETLCFIEVERVKRKNAKRMMKLGWEGVQKAAEGRECKRIDDTCI